MKDILEEIVAWKRQEINTRKAEVSLHDMSILVEKECHDALPSMKASISSSPTGIIAEFKRKSPSKGWIMAEGNPDIIPLEYQQNGAAAISILTDERFFGGNDDFIRRARQAGVKLPILYKNFVIDEYQLLQARLCGASAVLLIAACLDKEKCKALIKAAHDLGMEVLLEMHSEPEAEYAELNPDLCGVNNRNLGTFITDTSNSISMARLLPQDAVKVSESGISSAETLLSLQAAGYKGFLIGERFMKTGQPGKSLKEFINNINIKASKTI